MNMKKKMLGIIAGISIISTAAFAATQLSFNPSTPLSEPTVAPAENAANKGKILRLTDGTLIVVYGDAVDTAFESWDYNGTVTPARDIFLTYSKDDGATWSAPLNLSNTASQTDAGAFYDPDGNGPDGTGGLPPQNFYGNSDKPNIFAPGLGNNIMVSWTDKFCPGGSQGVASYNAPFLNLNPGTIQVPFSCTYVARLQNDTAGGTINLVAVDRLTDGTRDAKNDVARGGGGGNAIVWQEDPEGLQPGEAEGPGDGGSGANVSKGTDAWYSWLANKVFATGAWSAPQRISDNQLDNVGAARPNMFLGKHPQSPGKSWAIVAYEETKGLGTIEGKYVIYHVFPYDNPSAGAVPAGGGVIVSDPLENSRRVRFVAKGSPGSTNGTRIIMFWKQGMEDQGGPSDIMARVGHVPAGWDPTNPATTGFGWRPADLTPAVVGSADPATALGNAEPLNLSSAALTDESMTNPIDDARAHRAIIVGDFIAVGYSYTPDQAVARFTVEENYDFYIRRSTDGGASWDTPVNLSKLPKDLTVKEPRLVGSPGSVKTTCPSGDPAAADTTNTEDCQDKNVFYVAWGTELNQQESISQGSIDLSLAISRTTDKGDSYEPALTLVEGDVILDEPEDSQNGESQLRITPDGSKAFITWMQTTVDGKEVAFADGAPVSISTSDGGGGGCSMTSNRKVDLVIPLLILIGLGYLGRRRLNDKQ